MSFFVIGSSKVRPMRRLIAKKVLSGFVTAWRFAGWPTSLSPSSVKATIEGVVRAPSAFSITLGLDPSITATQELVVPRSMPIILPIIISLSRAIFRPRSGPVWQMWPAARKSPPRDPQCCLSSRLCPCPLLARAVYPNRGESFIAVVAPPRQRKYYPRKFRMARDLDVTTGR